MTDVDKWTQVLFEDTTPIEVFCRLQIPILYMTGNQSPASALSVANLLGKTLPNVTLHKFPSIGHMGPITHPNQINPVIAEFFASL